MDFQELEEVSKVDDELSVALLKGKQSVRATFRLSYQCVNLLSLAAGQLGVKQKYLFDQLVEDQRMLEKAADENRGEPGQLSARVQKTYVISRNSLDALQAIARRHNIPRDVLVEWSINRLRPIMSAEQEKHRKWLSLRGRVESLLEDGSQLLQDAEGLLDLGDQVLEKLTETVTTLKKNCQELNRIFDKGERLRELDDK